MSGSGRNAFARNNSSCGDRLYNPPVMHRYQFPNHHLQYQQQQLLQQQQQQQQQLMQRATRSNAMLIESGNRLESGDSLSSKSSSVCSSSSATAGAGAAAAPRLVMKSGTNLDRFLESIVPSVQAQCLSKTSMKALGTSESSDFHPYFNLGDLWESFKEWSAYGAGVPLVLNGSDSVVQYYVPYLSGIQLYVDPSKPSFRLRRPGEESDASDSSRETTSSEGSSEADLDRQSKHVNPTELRKSFRDITLGSSSDDGEVGNPPGQLIFNYMERDPPYSREPLSDKISVLASRHPALKTYRSCDLLPASWISVAWYPIYRIPTGPTLRDLDACFLTYHSLSTPWKSNVAGSSTILSQGSDISKSNGIIDASSKLSLPVFGLASYKFKGSVWTPQGLNERQQVTSLSQAADNWLRLLQVEHPDYRFFSDNSYRR